MKSATADLPVESGSAAPSSAPASVTPLPADYMSTWKERVGKFAEAVGKTIEDVNTAIAGVVGEPSQDALELLSDTVAAPDHDIKNALASLKIPSARINAHIGKLRGVKIPAPGASPSASLAIGSILPAPPDDDSFIKTLQTGGTLKANKSEVLTAVKAALAQGVGLYEVPDLVLEKMEAHAQALDEPVGEEYFEMQRLISEKKYAEVLDAIGAKGSYITERRRNEFLIKVNTQLWPALRGFQEIITAWQGQWNQSMNPNVMFSAMAASMAGQAMPPGMMAAPDTSALRASAEEVINNINTVFAVAGRAVSRAMAYDAIRIMKVLSNPVLPGLVGAGNKEQMLKELGINVGSEIVRIEQNLARYTLGIMNLPEITADSELAYICAMVQLGASIPWDKVTLNGNNVGRRAGLGRRRAVDLEEEQ